MRRWIGGVVIALIISHTQIASATILTFDFDPTLTNYDAIPANYGDHATAAGDSSGLTTWVYTEGNGYTPHVGIDYQSLGSTVPNQLDFWDSNYGDLTNVAFPSNNGTTGQITLTGDAGFNVTLNSFDMAGWNQVDRAETIQIYVDGVLKFDNGGAIVHGAGPSHDSFTPGLTGHQIVVQFGTDWDVGIDNINFDEVAGVAPVPEPSSIALLAVGIAGMGAGAYRRRKEKAAK